MGFAAMNLRHIEVFHAVYLNGSVSAAARALSVSQPTVSKVLRHAELRLGFNLFYRLGGKLVASDEGHILFKEVDELYRRIGSVSMTARNLKGGGQGHIRLAVPPALGLSIVPAAIARFRDKHRAVTFDVQTRYHDDLARSLYERECDLAVGYEAASHPRLNSSNICTGRLVVLHRRGELGEGDDPVRLEQLAGRDFISLAEAGPIGSLFARAVQVSAVELKSVVWVRTCYIAAALVRSGAGFAAIDEFTARDMLDPSVAYRPLEPELTFGVHAIHLADRPPSGTLSKFLAVLRQTAEQ